MGVGGGHGERGDEVESVGEKESESAASSARDAGRESRGADERAEGRGGDDGGFGGDGEVAEGGAALEEEERAGDGARGGAEGEHVEARHEHERAKVRVDGVDIRRRSVTRGEGGGAGGREAANQPRGGTARGRTSALEEDGRGARAGNAATRRSTVTPPSTSARGARERDAEDETRALNASDTPDGVARTREDMLASRVSRKPVRAAKRGRDASPARARRSPSIVVALRRHQHVMDRLARGSFQRPVLRRAPSHPSPDADPFRRVLVRRVPRDGRRPGVPPRGLRPRDPRASLPLARRVHRISPRPRVLVHVRRSRHGRTTGVLARRDPCLHPRQLVRRRGGARVLAARHRALRRARRRVGNRLSPRQR